MAVVSARIDRYDGTQTIVYGDGMEHELRDGHHVFRCASRGTRLQAPAKLTVMHDTLDSWRQRLRCLLRWPVDSEPPRMDQYLVPVRDVAHVYLGRDSGDEQ